MLLVAAFVWGIGKEAAFILCSTYISAVSRSDRLGVHEDGMALRIESRGPGAISKVFGVSIVPNGRIKARNTRYSAPDEC